MSHRPWTAVLASIMVLAVAPPAAASATEPGALRTRLDAVVAGGPTGALIEVRDGPRTIRLAGGTARAGTAEPVDPRGWFRAGSVTKMVLATVALQLVAERRLTLDTPVDRWLPGVLPPGNGVEVQHLLNHTSGLKDYTETLPLFPPSAFEPIRWKTWTPRQLVAEATAYPAEKPGRTYEYNSTGYLLLGMIIERVTGRPYAQEISRRILRPLHLRRTILPGADPRVPRPHARAYVPDGDGGVLDITEYNPSVMGAAGELVTTAADLNRFTTALLAGRLLPPAQLTVMKKIESPSTRGHGLERRWLASCEREAYGHSGDALGASTWTFATDPDHTVTLSVTWGTGRPTPPAVTALIETALCRTA